MLESRIFGPDEDSSRDSGKKNRTYAASLTVRARWGRIRFRDASQEAQYQRHVLDEDIRLSIRFLRIFFLVFAFGAVCFITMNGAFGRLGNDYLEVPHSAATNAYASAAVLGDLREDAGKAVLLDACRRDGAGSPSRARSACSSATPRLIESTRAGAEMGGANGHTR